MKKSLITTVTIIALSLGLAACINRTPDTTSATKDPIANTADVAKAGGRWEELSRCAEDQGCREKLYR